MDDVEKQNEKKICRTCLSSKKQNEFLTDLECPLEVYGTSIKNLLKEVVPELDLNVSDDNLICDLCLTLLKTSYEFKLKCLSAEERIFHYISTHPRTNNKIHISELITSNDADVDPKKVTLKEEYYISSEDEEIKPLFTKKDSPINLTTPTRNATPIPNLSRKTAEALQSSTQHLDLFNLNVPNDVLLVGNDLPQFSDKEISELLGNPKSATESLDNFQIIDLVSSTDSGGSDEDDTFEDVREKNESTVVMEKAQDLISKRNLDKHPNTHVLNDCEETSLMDKENEDCSIKDSYNEDFFESEYAKIAKRSKLDGDEMVLQNVVGTKKMEGIGRFGYIGNAGDVPDTPFMSCQTCTGGFKSQYDLENHIARHCEHRTYIAVLNKTNKSYVCPFCGRQCYKKRSFIKHFYHHQEKVPYKCKECPFICSDKSTLKTHKLLKHSYHQSIICVYCEKSFPNQYCLDHHMQTHEKNKEKLGENPIRTTTNQLIAHGPFCKRCQKYFLNEHEIMMHRVEERCFPTGEKRILGGAGTTFPAGIGTIPKVKISSCPYCLFSSTSLEQLRMHVLEHENADLNVSDDNLICDLCLTLLKTSYEFKLKCLSAEERIFHYISTHPRTNNKIHISELITSNDADVDPKKVTLKEEYYISSEDEEIKPLFTKKDSPINLTTPTRNATPIPNLSRKTAEALQSSTQHLDLFNLNVPNDVLLVGNDLPQFSDKEISELLGNTKSATESLDNFQIIDLVSSTDSGGSDEDDTFEDVREKNESTVVMEKAQDLISKRNLDKHPNTHVLNDCEETSLMDKENEDCSIKDSYNEDFFESEYAKIAKRSKLDGDEMVLQNVVGTKKMEGIGRFGYIGNAGDVPDTPFMSCQTCTGGFKSQYDLENHIARHCEHRTYIAVFNKTNKSYVCPFCGRQCYKKRSFIKHFYHHQEKVPYKCKECPFICSDKSTLKTHKLLKHSYHQSIICVYCEKSFPNQYCLDHHMQTHEKNKEKLGENPIRTTTNQLIAHGPFCKRCQKYFLNEHEIMMHRVEERCFPTGEKRILGGAGTTFPAGIGTIPKVKISSCPYCLFSSTSLEQLRMHVLEHENAVRANWVNCFEKVPYKCKECPFICSDKSTLKTHKLLKHSYHQSIICVYCEKSFPNQYCLDHHMQTHEKNKEKLGENPIRTTTNQLIAHGPFCKRCQKYFLNEHEIMMHRVEERCFPTGEKRILGSAGTTFPAGIGTIPKVKISSCPYCLFSSTSLEQLRMHVLEHENAVRANWVNCFGK